MAPARAPVRWPLRLAGAVVATVAALSAAGGALAQPTVDGWRRVTDATGALSVTVPAAWAYQLTDGGWDPAAVGLAAGRSPGLVMGADLTGWALPGRTSPGVFAGLGEGMGEAVPPAHGDCTRGADRPVVVDGLAGRVQRWTGCADRPGQERSTVTVPTPEEASMS